MTPSRRYPSHERRFLPNKKQNNPEETGLKSAHFSTSENAPDSTAAETHPRLRGEHRGARPPFGAAHPRLRGEHFATFRPVFPGVGSSPPARGTPSSSGYQLPRGGLIPACAGNTHPRHLAYHTAEAHPRLRGEHTWWADADGTLRGSSPPARGTRCTSREGGIFHGSSPPARGTRGRLGSPRSRRRLIPACAGNTLERPRRRRRRTAHPRLRGEHW